jgi:hypothetical protein
MEASMQKDAGKNSDAEKLFTLFSLCPFLLNHFSLKIIRGRPTEALVLLLNPPGL